MAELSDAEETFISDALEPPQAVRAGDTLDPGVEAGSPTLLWSGWAAARHYTTPDKFQIVRIFDAGDLIDLTAILGRQAPYQIRMQTDGNISKLAPEFLDRSFVEHPRLTRMVVSQIMIDQVETMERLRTLTGNNATERIVSFLLTMRHRQAVSGIGAGSRFMLPFNQAEIGSILGLTSVYVNRVLMSLRKEGFIEIERPYVRLLKPEELEESVDFIGLDYSPKMDKVMQDVSRRVV